MSESRKECPTVTTKPSFHPTTEASNSPLTEYRLAVITKPDSQESYGITAEDGDDSDALYVKEIGTDQALVQSIVDKLNRYRVPYVHFLDVIRDLMNEYD